MSQEREKLTTSIARLYPEASEILVSFPDDWELVASIDMPEGRGTPLYVAAMPESMERTSRDHFHGLAPEINLSLTRYRLYKFFQPWPMPTLFVDWNAWQGRGKVVGRGETKINLHPVGQAQTWTGDKFGVLWECFIDEPRRKGNWQGLLRELWQRVEEDMRVEKVFTLPQEPTFEKGYQDFLSGLGYAPDLEASGWWSKSLEPRTPFVFEEQK